MSRLWFVLLVAIGLGLAACGPTPTPPPPTETVLPPTPTSRPTRTLPATWTPGPPPTIGRPGVVETTPTATQQANNTARPGQSTLPPTWTPNIVPTVTRPPAVISTVQLGPRPTATRFLARLTREAPTGQPPTPDSLATFPAACATFSMTGDTYAQTLTGKPAIVAWVGVEGAEGYRVWVINAGGRYSLDQITAETQIEIPGEVFFSPGPYGWEVMPLINGDRLCPSITGVINARFSR